MQHAYLVQEAVLVRAAFWLALSTGCVLHVDAHDIKYVASHPCPALAYPVVHTPVVVGVYGADGVPVMGFDGVFPDELCR